MARKKVEPRVLEPTNKLRSERGYFFVVDYRDDSNRRKRKMFYHGELEKAKTFAESRNLLRVNQGTKAEALLDPETLTVAARCVSLLREHGKSLEDATRHYIEHLKRTARSATVEELWPQYLKTKQDAKKSRTYLQQIEIKLKRFSGQFGSRLVAEIQIEEAADYLNAIDGVPNTIHSHARVLQNFFNFAITRRYATENPVTGAMKEAIPDMTESEKHPLPVDKAAALLTASPDSIRATIAIRMFTGLRTSEAAALDWKDVDFSKSRIRVRAESAKARRSRYAEMTPALIGWLKPLAKSSGLVQPEKNLFQSEFAKARKTAGLANWRTDWHNALRDSFGTYSLALHEDAGKVSFAMGHSTPGLVQKHYAELATKEEAIAYFAIRSEETESEKIVQIA